MTDINYRVNLGLEYNSDSLFEKNKQMEYLQKQSDFISSIMSTLTVQDDEGNETPYFDIDFVIRKYFDMTDEELKQNQRYKDEKALKKEGYKQEDIAQILNGVPKDKFKPEKKKEDDDGGDDGGGSPLAGL
jgi:hypothetical protein